VTGSLDTYSLPPSRGDSSDIPSLLEWIFFLYPFPFKGRLFRYSLPFEGED